MIEQAISLRDSIRVEILKLTSSNRRLSQMVDNAMCQFRFPTFGMKDALVKGYKISEETADELLDLIDLYFDTKDVLSDLRKKQHLI